MYTFSAIKGIQANKEYYAAMVPLRILMELFEDHSQIVRPEDRAQRKLNIKRIPAIKKYILENRDSYVFSALAASIDGHFDFEPISIETTDLGMLKINKDATILINDGQHRKAALEEAINEDPTLMNETITVVFYRDMGLVKSQQMFTDLNRHAVKTSNSIAELYDSTDNVAELTRMLMKHVSFIDKYTDKEKDNLSKYSAALFVFNTFYKANMRIVGKGNSITEKTRLFIVQYWEQIVDNVLLWKQLEHGEISKIRLRSEYLVCQSVVIEAFGQLGAFLYNNPDISLASLKELRNVDWKRNCRYLEK